jgi:starch synthase
MRILFVSSEVFPFAKTGGLADVSGALPKALAARGAEVAVLTPWYGETAGLTPPVSDTGVTLTVPVGPKTCTVQVLLGVLPGSEVPVYFFRHDPFFRREGLYQAQGRDHPDNAARFVLFSRAALECLEPLGLRPDVIHANDWQTALVPVYARTLYAGKPLVSHARTLLTIHNLGYQGLFWHFDMPLTGLPWKVYHWRGLEFHDRINFLKGGIVYADRVNTVSRTYAAQIQTKAYGFGLEGVLAGRADRVSGVVNGIDTELWNPASDPHIAAAYTADDLSGKSRCKAALLAEAGIGNDGFPLFAAITRLDAQKGVDLIGEILDDAVTLGMRFILLGTGDEAYHEMLKEAQARHPGRVRVFLAFDSALAHRIEAGADAFLMPSRYEPCGLNQLMSLRYGTVPIVRATGGLADTVKDFSDVGEGRANGFVFRKEDPSHLLAAVARALRVYSNPSAWTALVRTGMGQDWSWNRSAGEYMELYERVVREKRPEV